MIKVFINNQLVELDSTTPLTAVVEKHTTGNAFAVAINEIFVPKTQYADTAINDGDRIEILAPMQGG